MRPAHHGAAIPGAVWALHTYCADMPVSFQDTMPPGSVLPPRRAPRKGMGHPQRAYGRRPGAQLGRCRDAGCAEHVLSVISDLVRPSPTLLCTVLMGHHHVDSCATKALLSTRPSIQHGRTLEPVYGRQPNTNTGQGYPRSHPCTSTRAATSPAKAGIHHLATPENESSRTTVTPQALHADTTTLYKIPCNTSVSCLPLAYKRRRQPPSYGHVLSSSHPHSRIHVRLHTTRHWHFASIILAGT
jgi:hypothetical protein